MIRYFGNKLKEIKAETKDGENTSTTNSYYDIDGQRVRKVEDDFETNYMYVGSLVLYTADNNGNKATENILDPSGMGDIIWGTPSGDISGTTDNYTSIPLSSHSESLLNGIPASQELSRVSESVARIQDKAGENDADDRTTEINENSNENTNDIDKNCLKYI